MSKMTPFSPPFSVFLSNSCKISSLQEPERIGQPCVLKSTNCASSQKSRLPGHAGCPCHTLVTRPQAPQPATHEATSTWSAPSCLCLRLTYLPGEGSDFKGFLSDLGDVPEVFIFLKLKFNLRICGDGLNMVSHNSATLKMLAIWQMHALGPKKRSLGYGR